jgi:hypothetical protein
LGKPFIDSGVVAESKHRWTEVFEVYVIAPTLDRAFARLHHVVYVIHDELVCAVVDVPIGVVY